MCNTLIFFFLLTRITRSVVTCLLLHSTSGMQHDFCWFQFPPGDKKRTQLSFSIVCLCIVSWVQMTYIRCLNRAVAMKMLSAIGAMTKKYVIYR